MEKEIPAYAETAEAVLSRLGVDPARGLDDAEAESRLSRFGPNILRYRPKASVFGIFLAQFASPVVYLLMAAAAVALFLGERVEFIAIAVVLAINAAIGFVTELRAVRSMEALRTLTTRSALVRRSGRAIAVPAEKLVPGDIAILDAGDVAAADMRLIAAANLAVDESVLTGESLPVSKSVAPVEADALLADRTNTLFKGCAITRGTGEAVITATGMASELGRISRLAEEAEPERSPLERQLAVLSRHLIWLTLAVAAAVGVAGIVAGHGIRLMIESAVALAVAAIPEGLPIVATLALARGMLRMARHNAVIEQLSAVETLGAATVILTDKTGTLTENRMHVDRIVTAAGDLSFDRATGEFLRDGAVIPADPGTPLARALTAAALCNNATLATGGALASGDPMEVALLEAAAAGGFDRPALLDTLPEVAEHAFDVETRMMATVHRDGDVNIVAVKGAPEAVFGCVDTVATGTTTAPFDRSEQARWERLCDLIAGQGLRLIALAGKQGDDGEPYRGLTLYGVVGLQDPPRPDVASAIADARRAGISVVMVTGDHAATARTISDAVSLADGDAGVLGGRDLKPLADMTPDEVAAARATRIFSRVSPEQKLDLIALHQQAGEVVAMTGDGVNDAPALKKADIGIAMGLRGTQVAREAADMVLRDDAFSTIVHAIREGRVIYGNIRRFTTYLLSCNLSEILIVGLAVIGGLPLPLLPLQILFLNLVTDVFPAFALGTVDTGRDVLQRAPRPPDEPILARPQWVAIAVHGTVISLVTLTALIVAHYGLDLDGDHTTSMCFYTLALAQLWHVFNMHNWREGLVVNAVTTNAYVWLAILLCLAILAVAALVPPIADALRLVALPPAAWATLLGLSVLPVLLRRLAALVMRARRR
ncbi:MAG: cation-transporting P-type ATPase [Rhodobiaceae bacterium]|nr:cation-transporting P-type ATPase [Rhodobiaceae bacterium]